MLHDKQYLGFVDVADLVAAVLEAGVTRPKPEGWLQRVGNMFTEDTVHHVDHAVNKSGRDKFVWVSREASMLQVALFEGCPRGRP
jgi:hypothetical protein